ncbi:MAG TPA: ornithine cyclodeaminase family protein [Steroidobacteraceae bacterium]|nr:ornithine cyclodeaminase family protein [Steroidobacteraceae bacterium]
MLQLDAFAIAARLDRRALIDALDAAFREPYEVPARVRYQVKAALPGDAAGTLLVMPAWRVGGALGIKLVTVFPENTRKGLPTVAATYLVLDATTGAPRALLDGGEITARRTGAASALASRYLSRSEASRLTMVGTGRLAPHLIESHAVVRPIREVRIWGRRLERARSLAASLARPGWSVEGTDDLEAAVRWADIISCATLSRRPLVRGAWLEAGQHVDLVGAFTAEMCEVDDEAIARSELYVDTREGALDESGEIIGALARGVIDDGAVRAELKDLASGAFARSSPAAITLFKSVGTALEDLVAAELALE